MGTMSAIVWCLAYILGLLMSAIPFGGVIVLACGIIIAIVLIKFQRIAISRLKPELTIPRVWIIAGVIGLIAGAYLQIQSPQPSAIDISRFVPDKAQDVKVYGRVDELPRLTRSGNLQIWLNVTGLGEKKADGKLYVTLPQREARDLYPGEAIAIVGSLYKPKPAMNPGGFNFQKYLAREGSFAGLKGSKIQLIDPNQKPSWGWWMIRQKIVRSHVEQLGESEGAIVSAMVLGSRVVDIPFELKDAFSRVGMSHALAASGFQVSLILSTILVITRRLPKLIQASCGAIGLITFLGLAGLEAAVVRAIVMGFAVLMGIVLERRIKPLGSLLFAATTLLIVNPMWIWDLGFQFSFLATLGLLVTVPALTKRLDWLPTIVVPAIAVPIAAFAWTLPLQLYMFGIVSPYSIAANIITTILISIISIGAVISSVLNLISPMIGSVAASAVHYPTFELIYIIKFFCQLPGNSIAVGTISILLMLVLYALIFLPWMQPKYQHQWWILLLMGVSLVFIPAWYTRANLFKVTALSVGNAPVLVVQDHNRVGLINSGDAAAVRFTVLPFLRKEGINQIDWAIAAQPATTDGWAAILEQMPIRSMYDFSGAKQSAVDLQTVQRLTAQQGKHIPIATGQTVKTGAIAVRALSIEPTIVQFQMNQQSWLWLGEFPNKQQRRSLGNLADFQTLWWSGRRIYPKFLEALKVQTAIAYSNIHPETLAQLQQRHIQTYQTRYGALEWTLKGFKPSLELDETNAPML